MTRDHCVSGFAWLCPPFSIKVYVPMVKGSLCLAPAARYHSVDGKGREDLS